VLRCPEGAPRSADGWRFESKGCQPSLGTEQQGRGCAPKERAIHLGCNQVPAGWEIGGPIGLADRRNSIEDGRRTPTEHELAR